MTDTTPQNTHSPWGASAAYRWMACPGSIALGRDIPSPRSSFYAAEGTVAHDVAEQCLRSDAITPYDFIGHVFTHDGHDITVTEEMADAVQVYVDTVKGDRLSHGGLLSVERGFDITDTLRTAGLPVRDDLRLYGTNDAMLFVPESGLLIVYDYKHGAGHAVGVEWNPQLLYYALGACQAHENARKYRVADLELVIVQPRAGHPDGPVRRWRVSLMDLLEWTVDLVAAVKATLDPAAPLRAGPQCDFCKAKSLCPEQHRIAQSVVQVDFADLRALPPEPATLTMEQLYQVLAQAGMVEDWIAAVRAHAHSLAERGQAVPGFKLVQKRATRQYVATEDDVVKFGESIGLNPDDVWAPAEVKTVAQLEGVLKKQGYLRDPDIKSRWDGLWEKRSSGTTLVPESDPREPVAPPALAAYADLVPNPLD